MDTKKYSGNSFKQTMYEYFEKNAVYRDKWIKRNKFYHKTIENQYSFMIPVGSKVLDLGCSTGDLLNSVKPKYGLGVDFSETVVEIAKQKYPHLNFVTADVEEYNCPFCPDYIIVSDLVAALCDVQKFFNTLRKYCAPDTKIIVSTYNYGWETLLKLGELLHIKQKQPLQNWLSVKDLKNILHLENFEAVKTECKLLLPKYVPLLNLIFNRFVANLPIINNACLINFVTIRPVFNNKKDYTVSIIIPARNEQGNIENAILRTPDFSAGLEFIFVEGNSQDDTYNECLRIKEKYPEKNIKVMQQSGRGKGNAVREAFAAATGEILMILDADLTTPPEDLPKFYEALRSGKCDFVNGCRLVYPMEKQAMRFLNFIANKFFGMFFSYLLGQQLKDTLCGTKVLFKKDYQKIAANRSYFGDFDPFGDFDLLFGAAKLNLKILEVIVRYRDRQYGTTQISRFKHGWLLIRMSIFAAKKIKFR